MNAADLETCAWCPRLCRHVCPVAVATGLERATPTALATMALLALRGDVPREEARAAASFCLGCGACTDHCRTHEPVARMMRALRPIPEAAPLPPIEGDGSVVCVLAGEHDWSDGRARVRTADDLGHAAWKAGAPGVLEAVARHFIGRRALAASGAVAEVLAAAGVPVERLPLPEGERVFRTCWEGARSGPGQLACCGRREGFHEREPGAARVVAEENARMLGAGATVCDDEACAAWLRAHGADVRGSGDAP